MQHHPYEYKLGLTHGSQPGHPFSPHPEWTGYQKSLYGQGFDVISDRLTDQQSKLAAAS